jgi:hypothetical protein
MSKKFELDKFDVSEIVQSLITRASNFDSDRASRANLIDPFAAALESALNGYSTEQQWIDSEHQRTRQKNLMNHIGNLQQSIIGKLDGWTSFPSGSNMPDVVGVRGNQKFLFEVKNKHNTMNSSSAAETYDNLENFLNRPEFSGFVGGVVAVISPVRKPYFKQFAPSGRTNRDDIVWLPGRVFYAIATDPLSRVPFISVNPRDDLHLWDSWKAIDLMVEEFWREIELQTGYKTPEWIKDLTNQALGSA